MKYNILSIFLLSCILIGCTHTHSSIPTIGYIDAFNDPTLAKARKGFFDALALYGYAKEKNTLHVLYRNAEGSIPTLTEIVNYLEQQNVVLLATNTNVSTIAAITNNTYHIPIFEMVSLIPTLLGQSHNIPPEQLKWLFGTGSTPNYIDTSVFYIPAFFPPQQHIRMGVLFNPSEYQSKQSIEEVKKIAREKNITLIIIPAFNSSDISLSTASLIHQGINAFFAMPDNVVFSSFETIQYLCTQAKIPIFTSEVGLVTRGAVAACGPSFYQWGYQAGIQVANYLKNKSLNQIHADTILSYPHVYNPTLAHTFHLIIPPSFNPY